MLCVRRWDWTGWHRSRSASRRERRSSRTCIGCERLSSESFPEPAASTRISGTDRSRCTACTSAVRSRTSRTGPGVRPPWLELSRTGRSAKQCGFPASGWHGDRKCLCEQAASRARSSASRLRYPDIPVGGICGRTLELRNASFSRVAACSTSPRRCRFAPLGRKWPNCISL